MSGNGYGSKDRVKLREKLSKRQLREEQGSGLEKSLFLSLGSQFGWVGTSQA
ncbi:MAG: hypothetical protein ACYDBT_00490 [Desulfobulbaceae bacterium]